MAGNFDVSYSVGFLADTNDLTKKVELFKASLQNNPISLKTQLPGMDNTAEAQKTLDAMTKGMANVSNVTVETRQWTDALGKLHEEIIKVNAVAIDQNNNTVKLSNSVKNTITGLNEQRKSYADLSDKAKEWSVRADSLGEKDKTAIKKTTDSLMKNIESWDKLATTHQQNTKKAQDLRVEIEKGAKALDLDIARTKESAIQKQSWGDRLAAAIKQTITYTFTIGLMRAAQQELNKAIKFTIDLNTEMTKIQVLQSEGAQTPEEINALAQSFNNLAKEMGTTTLAVAQGSVEWLRQGKTVQETQELLRASTMLSKLGALDAAQATEYLTSTLNSYGMAAEEAVSIVDKLVQVDNISATSTKELATALRYSAATAKQAGVELEELISYIAVVSSTTRQNAESIGQGMKTMFTRMQDIKAGAIDEDGLGLNNVESALARVNIQLRDTPTSFRDMSDVLEDVAAKWSTLNEIEQANISKAIAGIRQQNLFQVLMQNMSKAIEYQTEQYNANGVALDRYGIYLESIEAKQQKLKASFEALYMSADFEKLIKWALDLAIKIVDVVDSLGGLKTILGIVIPLVISLITYKLVLAGAAFKATLATEGLTVALTGLGMTPIGAILMAIGVVIIGVVAAVDALNVSLEEAQENFQKASDESVSASNKVKNTQSSINEIKALWEEYEKLRSILYKTKEETQDFIEVQNKLAELSSGEILGSYDSQLNYTIDINASLDGTISRLEEQLRVEKEIAAIKAITAAVESDNLAKKSEESLQKTEEDLRNAENKTNQAKIDLENSKTYWENLMAEKGETPALLRESKKEIDKLTDAYDAAFLKEQEYRTALLELNKNIAKGATDVVSVYKNLSTEEDKLNFKRTVTSQAALDAITKYDAAVMKSFSDQQYREHSGYVYGQGQQTAKIKFEIDSDGLLKQYDEISEKIQDFQDKQNEMALGKNLAKNTAELIAMGAAYDTLEDGTVVITDNVNTFTQSLIDAVNEGYELGDLADRWGDLSSELLNIADSLGNVSNETYDVTLKQEDYKNAIGQATEAMWNQVSENSAALSVLSANGITNINQLYTFLYKGGPEVERFFEQLALVTSTNVKVIMQNFMKDYQAFINGITNFAPETPMFYAPAGGGGGGGGENPAKKAIDEKIKALEKEKKALQDRIKQFKEYIDLQKESLKRAKEEADFNSDMQKKAKDLAKLKNQILVLSLDDSEEARAKRLKLEEEAAELEAEMAEDNEDRKLELQLQALDDLQKAFEDGINKQIEAIDKLIEKLREQAEAISGGGGGAGGGGGGSLVSSNEKLAESMAASYAKMEGLSAKQQEALEKEILRLLDLKTEWSKLPNLVDAYIRKLQWIKAHPLGGTLTYDENGNISGGYTAGGTYYVQEHQGGLIESHHDGDFAGNLTSNEVFAKLLKGEYVATEGQMDNFMKNILPKFMQYPMGTPSDRLEQIKNQIQLTINVNGSLDRTVIPDLEAAVFKALNNALKQKGKKTNAFNYSV